MPVRFPWPVSSVLNTLYPGRCNLCGTIDEPAICSVCGNEFIPLHRDLIIEPRSDALDYRASLFRYESRAAQAVIELKFSRCTGLVASLGALMKSGVFSLGLHDMDAIVPVPIHWNRACFRGFNQSLLLCRDFPPELVRPELLLRIRSTKPQVGLSIADRLSNLENAFLASPPCADLSILLIDDVMTSGGTARECARTLKNAGAARIGIVTLTGSA